MTESIGNGVPNDGREDVRRAIAELGERLPPRLQPLAHVAFNYRWVWTPGGADVFRSIAPDLWGRLGYNPRGLIEAVPPHRLWELQASDEYVDRVTSLAASIDGELALPPADGPIAPDRPVAFFCSEFGVHSSLPLYGGGLGVLAGDMLKAASDAALPMVGVGLLYREGYFHQRLDMAGWQHEYWTPTQFERLPTVLVTGADRRPVVVQLNIGDRPVHVQVWRVDVGRVPLYLLDTDRSDNHAMDRWITARLYIGDRETRLAQYAVLGVAGVRVLDALGIRPGIVHMNEGHAGLGALERIGARVAAGATLDVALADVRAHTVFTTHTPVAAGNEWYSRQEVEHVLGTPPDVAGTLQDAFYDLGRSVPGNPAEPVCITALSLRTSGAANGVSRRHGEVAREMWRALWPGLSVDAVPIRHVTNGIHTTTWMADAMQRLMDRRLGEDWRRRLLDPALWERFATVSDGELWEVRQALRRVLVEFIRESSIPTRLARGEDHDYVETAARVFDADVLTIGFARRVATYKRLHLLTRQIDRGVRLLGDPERPIQVVIAGKAHPQDDEAKQSLRRVMELRHVGGVSSRIVFLEDYDLHMATKVVAGCDVWVNLPRPPLEASGTSGMKAAVNGGINLSVLDGWWIEADDGQTGWSIATPPGDHEAQDDHDAGVLLDTLQQQVIPLFYDRGPDGIPHGWVTRVRASMTRLIPRFSAARMLRDYVTTMYGPA